MQIEGRAVLTFVAFSVSAAAKLNRVLEDDLGYTRLAHIVDLGILHPGTDCFGSGQKSERPCFWVEVGRADVLDLVLRYRNQSGQSHKQLILEHVNK